MPERVLHLAAYDISDETRLRKALHVAKQYATGGQRSVFECFLTQTERAALSSEMTQIMEDSEDRFLLLRLDPRSRILALGIAVPPIDPPFYYIG